MGSIVDQSFVALDIYGLSIVYRDLEMDGRQSVTLAGILAYKILLFGELVGLPDSYGRDISATVISLGVGVTASVWKSIPESKRDEFTNKYLLGGAANCVGRQIYNLLQNGDKIVNTAFAVYYVAQLALFGFQAGAALGLTSLALVALKQSGYVPVTFDRSLLFFQPLLDLFALIGSDRWLPLKVAILLGDIFALSNHPFLKWGEASDLLVEKHNFEPLAEIPDELPSSFTINRSYVYNDTLSTLMPDLEKVEDAKETAKKYMLEIESRNPDFTEGEKEGWERFRAGVCEGRFQGDAPSNIDLFYQLMAASLKSVSLDRDWLAKSKELAEIGSHCVILWTGEIGFFYNPQSKSDYVWSVHTCLAKWRSHMVFEVVQKTLKDSYLAMSAGEANNAHLMEDFQHWARHRIRPYDGEISHQIEHPGPLECLFWRLILNGNSKERGYLEQIILQYYIDPFPMLLTYFLGEFGLAGRALESAEKKIFDAVDTHIEMVYQAINPTYIEVDGQMEFNRTIPWSATTSWMDQMVGKFDLDDVAFYQKYVTVDDYEQSILTKEGVKLLLWDLGILQAAQ